MYKILFWFVNFLTVFLFAFGVPEDVLFTSHVKKQKPTNYLNYAGKTYYFGNVFRANFYGAFQFCRQQGMQLVSIMNDAENDRLGKFADEIGLQYEHFWTSGTNLANPYRFIWLSTGSAIVYSNWYPGEPSGHSSDGKNLTENCVEATRLAGPKGLYWNDRYCFDELSFICEKYGNECRR
ncbi:C-type lectin 37Da-like [Diabrotica virgifera virgifera]|uniref:C-type lectin 37Da-like n=1 Tax=Diabrotica virgifera virgifera TaxID=50390 RepID=A0A6P7GM87_DIAVI|nr:C-type lectin 37Da-like [Diabrotica virgifera virgifera]